MFMQSTRVSPAMGKLAEVEALLCERVKADQSRGRRVFLSRGIFSNDGPRLDVTLLAEDMPGLERVRQENLADPTFQAFVAKLPPLLDQAPTQRVSESLLTSPRPGTTISSLSWIVPALGKQPHVTTLLEDFVKAGQAAGVTTGLWRRVFSSDGTMFLVIVRGADMAEIDRVRKERASATRELAAAIGAQLRAPVQQQLSEVVVPLPS